MEAVLQQLVLYVVPVVGQSAKVPFNRVSLNRRSHVWRSKGPVVLLSPNIAYIHLRTSRSRFVSLITPQLTFKLTTRASQRDVLDSLTLWQEYLSIKQSSEYQRTPLAAIHNLV
jgi:hypothetical protein